MARPTRLVDVVVLPALLLTGVLAGCGGGDTASAGGGVIDPCLLITAGDIRGMLGGTVGAGVSEAPVAGMRACRYDVAGGSLGDGTVSVNHARFRDTDAAGFARMRAAAGKSATLIDVPGVGDEAYFAPIGHFLAFRKGGTVIQIVSLTSVDDSTVPAGVTAVGELVATALP